MKWATRFTERFPCKYPLMGAPMAGPSRAKLAAATTNAGALGFIAAGHFEYEELKTEIAEYKKLTNEGDPLCIGFIGYSSFSTLDKWIDFEDLLKTYKPIAVQFFAPSISFHPDQQELSNIALAQKYGTLVISQVGSFAEGMQVYQNKVDCIIAQGSEAGGHGLRPPLGRSAHVLASELVSKTKDVPILLAGGVVNGRSLASALALGCDGAVLGTRLWASEEADGLYEKKECIAKAHSCDDTTRSTIYDQIQNPVSKTPWPKPYDSIGSLTNDISDEWYGKEEELNEEIARNPQWIQDYRSKQFDPKANFVLAGQGSGEIESIEPTESIIKEIVNECETQIKRLRVLI